MSTSFKKKISFGRYLLKCRQERGISAEVLASELKISVNLIAAIEKEDFPSLPDVVYTRGFLRAYADVVGADRQWVVENYLNTLSIINMMQDFEEEHRKEGELFWRRLGSAAFVLLGVMIITVLVSGVWKDRTPATFDERPGEAALTVDPSTDKKEADIRKSMVDRLPGTANEDGIRLSILTIEETWIKIIIDNKTTREYSLRPGDRLDLEASLGYNLLIGNATGINLSANRIPIHVPGRRGEVVNIEIP